MLWRNCPKIRQDGQLELRDVFVLTGVSVSWKKDWLPILENIQTYNFWKRGTDADVPRERVDGCRTRNVELIQSKD